MDQCNADRWRFLSRLCGGELRQCVGVRQCAFLSRLCGGELLAAIDSGEIVFLSRLCGGELKQFSANLLYFQSVKER